MKFMNLQNGGQIQPEMALFVPSSPKPHPRTKHEGDQLRCCTVRAIWSFPKCV